MTTKPLINFNKVGGSYYYKDYEVHHYIKHKYNQYWIIKYKGLLLLHTDTLNEAREFIYLCETR